jgi:hypothetical protein
VPLRMRPRARQWLPAMRGANGFLCAAVSRRCSRERSPGSSSPSRARMWPSGQTARSCSTESRSTLTTPLQGPLPTLTLAFSITVSKHLMVQYLGECS